MVSKSCLSSLAHRSFIKSRMWKLSRIVKHSSQIYCLWHKYHLGIQNQILFSLNLLFLHVASKNLPWDLKFKILGIQMLLQSSSEGIFLGLFFCPSREKQDKGVPVSLPNRLSLSPHPPHPAACRGMTSVYHVYCFLCPLVSCWTPQSGGCRTRTEGKGERDQGCFPLALSARLPGVSQAPSHCSLKSAHFHTLSFQFLGSTLILDASDLVC